MNREQCAVLPLTPSYPVYWLRKGCSWVA